MLGVLLLRVSAAAQTDKVTFNPSRQGVAHSPWRQGVVLNAPQGGRAAADLPAVVNSVPPTYEHTESWYSGYRRTYRAPVVADDRPEARLRPLPPPFVEPPAAPLSSAPYRLGEAWAEDLLLQTAGWDDFVRYLRDHLAGAAPEFREKFRRGFLAVHGRDGPAVWAGAWAEAAPSGPAWPVTLFSRYGTVTVR